MLQKEEKRKWLQKELGNKSLNAEFVSRFASAFSISDAKVAASEIAELLEEDRDVEAELEDFSRDSLIRQAEEILAEMRATGAYAPTVGMLGFLSRMRGLDQPQKVEVQVAPAPEASVVRERIAALLQKESIQQRAKQAEIDLQALASDDTSKHVLDVGDQLSQAKLLARRTGTAEATESEPSTPIAESDALSNDAGPDNLAATWVAQSPALGPK
jgi:hypothetical protein